MNKLGFNSRLVRLAAFSANSAYSNSSPFQFQIGPIGRKPTDLSCFAVFEFQFQIGPIGRGSLIIENLLLTCFNSRLVRLAGRRLNTYINKLKKFQFQIGPIGRRYL